MRVLAVAYYRLKALAAARLTLLLMLLSPLAGVWAADTLLARPGEGVPVAVVDLDRSEYSRLVVDRLAARDGLRVVEVAEAEAVRLVQTRRVEAALILDAGFMDRIRTRELAGAVRVLQSPASLLGGLVGEYVASEVIRLSAAAMAADWVVAEYQRRGLLAPGGQDALWQEVWAHTGSYWEPVPLMTVTYREAGGSGAGAGGPGPATPAAAGSPGRGGRDLSLIGLMGTLVFLNALLPAAEVIQDRDAGIIARLRATGTGPLAYALGHALAVGLTGAATLAVAGVTAAGLGRPVALPPAAALPLVAYLVAAAGLSVLAGALARTRQQLQAVLPLLVLATGLCGGVPGLLGEVSDRFALLGRLTPQGWLLAGVRAALFGTPVLPAAAVLGGMGILALGIGGRRLARLEPARWG